MIILITGISSGFGKAMAERLSKDGHTVYGTYRKTDTFIQGVRYLKADVRDGESVRAAVAEILKEEGRIDLFIAFHNTESAEYLAGSLPPEAVPTAERLFRLL